MFAMKTFSDEPKASYEEENKLKWKKSRIRETPTLLTAADSRTDTNLKMLGDLFK